jgi:hypothetical protein
MSEERKKEVQNSLSKSNVLLERYHSYIAKRHGRLGFKTLSNENFTKIDLLLKIVEASKTHPNQDFAIENTIILAKDVREIAASKLLEEEIISSISPMLSKITKKYSEFSDVCLDREDLYCEAVRSALTAIYTYQGDKRLSTYLYTCVSNEIRNLCNKTSPFSKVGKNAMKIKRRFEDAKNDLGEFATFDEIVNYAKLSSKETLILQRLSVTIAGQSSIDKEDGNSALDYSFLGKKFMGMDGTISFSCSNANSDSFVIRSDRFEEESPPAIDLNELTELERIVLQGFMESSTKNLGINSLAKKLINPKTGKPYSRMAITFAWRRVKEKISKTLKVA